MALGGHVRVGLEDNIYHVKGVLSTNLGLLTRMKQIALAMGRDVATPAEARQMLGLSPKHGNTTKEPMLGMKS